ncbi:MAG TPA: hypothetical protein VN922_10625, partial [Bacteroidia bacterium]|nr:hypothetical protein [Bacteroidia bacterium]
QYDSRKRSEPSSYKLAMNISEGNKRINLKRKEPYNPVEPEEYLPETPLPAIPKYEREPSHEQEVIEDQLSSYDEIIEKLKSVGAIDEQGNIYKKNETIKRGNAFELVSYALNKRSKLKKRDVGIYTLAQWIKELGFHPQLFNNHFQGLLNSPILTRSKALATNSSTPSTPKASRTPFRTPTGWINF